MSRARLTETVLQGAPDFIQGVDDATVQVNIRSGGTAAIIYQTETGAPTWPNPLTTRDGRIEPTTAPGGEAWLDANSYTLVVTYGGVTYQSTFEAISGVIENQSVRNSNASNPINTASVYQSTSGADASMGTDFHGLFNTPSTTRMSSLEDYAVDGAGAGGGTTIYQVAGGVYNTGTKPAVAVAGFARGNLVWGSNLVVMADGAGSVATGMEIDFGIVTNSVGVANGLELHAHNAAGNPGHYLGMLARAGAQNPAPRVGIQIAVNAGTDQPLQAAGTILETSGAIQAAYGFDLHTAAFTGAAAYLPVNPTPGTATKGLWLENAGGATNTQAMMQFSSANASSKSTYGIRFVSAAGASPPVTAGGKLIYVDGGSYAQALDISAATFAASGAIAMGDNNISFGTATGGKIGTNVAQKLAFYNSTPIAQFATTGTSAGFTAGAGTAVTHLSTFTGSTGSAAYTIADVVRALKQLGLMAP